MNTIVLHIFFQTEESSRWGWLERCLEWWQWWMESNFKRNKERHWIRDIKEIKCFMPHASCKKLHNEMINYKIKGLAADVWNISLYYSDGEFFISFEDFIKYFGKIELVNLNPIRMKNNETRMARTFNMISVRGKWVRGVNAGGANTNYANNPQYR